MFIYKITNLLNGRVYIGQTVHNPNKRFQQHCSTHSYNVSYIKRSILKHSQKNFLFEVIDNAISLNELNQKECFYITIFNTMSPNGYNLHTGGDGHTVSDVTRTRISKSKKGIPSPKKGKPSNHIPWNKNTRSILAESIDKTFSMIFDGCEHLRSLGFHKSHVYEVINGRYKQYSGFTWRYA